MQVIWPNASSLPVTPGSAVISEPLCHGCSSLIPVWCCRKTVAQKGHISLKQAPQQQQQSGKCMYMPRIPRKDHHGRLRGYHPKKAAFVVSLWAHVIARLCMGITLILSMQFQ